MMLLSFFWYLQKQEMQWGSWNGHWELSIGPNTNPSEMRKGLLGNFLRHFPHLLWINLANLSRVSWSSSWLNRWWLDWGGSQPPSSGTPLMVQSQIKLKSSVSQGEKGRNFSLSARSCNSPASEKEMESWLSAGMSAWGRPASMNLALDHCSWTSETWKF